MGNGELGSGVSGIWEWEIARTDYFWLGNGEWDLGNGNGELGNGEWENVPDSLPPNLAGNGEWGMRMECIRALIVSL